ncbi:MAG: hypothetical protein KIS87_05195 [Phycisphaeraceae bacterium]|nr:hypothetical protein [Phycisphaeraceae bacterium]
MAGRQSLYDEKDFGSAAPAKRSGGGGGMQPKDKVKAAAAGALLLVAGVLLAWNFGLFDAMGGSKPEPITPEQQRATEEQERKMKEIESAIPPTQMYQGSS